MVGFNHDHDDDEPCRGCVAALQVVLELDIENGEDEFDKGFGDLIDSMHNALAAIHRARRERFTSKHDEIANTQDAATELVRVASAIHQAIADGRGMIDPSDE